MLKVFWQEVVFELKNSFTKITFFNVAVVAIVIYAFLYPQPYTSELIKSAKIAIVDDDRSSTSQEFLRALEPVDSIDFQYSISIKESKKWLEDRSVIGILYIPQHFEKDLIQGRQGNVILYNDASYLFTYAETVESITMAILEYGNKVNLHRQTLIGIDPIKARFSTAFNIEIIKLFNPQSGYATFSLPPIFILIIHQCLLVATTLVSFNKLSSRKQINIVTNNKPGIKLMFKLLLPRFTSLIIIFSINLIFYLLMLKYFYNIPQLASIFNLTMLVIPFFLSLLLMANLLAFFIKNTEDIFLLIIPISVMFFFASGISWPNYAVPTLLKIFHLVPAIPAMVGFVQLNQMGSTLIETSYQILLLWGLVILYAILNYFMLLNYFKKVNKHHAKSI